MNYQALTSEHQAQISALFQAAFTASTGPAEGALVGRLASELADQIDDQQIIGLGAFQSARLVGALFLTRLALSQPLQIYMVAPVAVSTAQQGQGVGQGLLTHALQLLKQRSVAVAVTYGDPAYYRRVGFEPLPEQVLPAPLPLSMPHGWLGQTLTAEPIPTVRERPRCVEAFNKPVYW